MKKFLAVLLLSVSTVVGAQNVSPTSTVEPGQVYSTGNLVNNTQTATDTTSTWQNVVFQQSLTCWAPGGPGNCGPMPTYRPESGSFNFSYGLTDVYQIVNISKALASSGTGLQVNGFNFGFTAKNGNGWDDGRVDTLSAYVNFYDKNNNLATNYYFDLNYKFDWTTFYNSKTFDNPYAVSDLSNVRYGFVGRDNNFWAGTYGPEIYGVNFSLKYSVDPCIKDPLYSPTCPGYMDALNKLIAPTTTSPVVQETTVVASAPIVSEPVVTTQNTPSTTTQTSTPVAVVQVVQPVVSQPTSTQTTVSQSVTPQTTVAQTSSSQTQQQTSGPALSTVLNMIQNNAKREQTIAAAAVASANETAQNAVQAAEQTALSVAATSSAASMANTTKTEQKSTAPVMQTASSSTQMASAGPAVTNVSTTNTQQSFQLQTQAVQNTSTNNTSVTTTAGVQAIQSVIQSPQVMTRVAPAQITNTQTNNNVTLSMSAKPETNNSIQLTIPAVVVDSAVNLLQAPTTVEAPKPTVQMAAIEMKNLQDNDLVVFSNNFLTNRANPLTEIVENNTRPTNTSVEQKENTINRNAVNNELAGGVQLERMAVQPAGYNLYLQLAMRDVAFYAPKEIYRNQRVIDNQRAVRLLNFASELKHQEMVDLQYGGNK